jgi:hypothetical protein
MPRNHRLVATEQLGNLAEREPDRLPLEPHVQPDLAVRSLVEDYLAAGLVHLATPSSWENVPTAVSADVMYESWFA